MKHPEEQIRLALHEHFKALKEGIKLPELWCVKSKLNIGALRFMTTAGIQAWFCGFNPARNHGMWWTLDVEDYVYLHGTCGEKPVVDRLSELILWLSCFEEPPLDGRITRKNFSLLTRAT
jgi:hypothetical protein